MEKLIKEMHGFFSLGRGLPLLIPGYSGINKEQRIHDRSKTAHRRPPVKRFLTIKHLNFGLATYQVLYMPVSALDLHNNSMMWMLIS